MHYSTILAFCCFMNLATIHEKNFNRWIWIDINSFDHLLVTLLKDLIQLLIKFLVNFHMQGGILIGPSAPGRSKAFMHAVFPSSSLTVLDTLANFGLLFFLFLVRSRTRSQIIKSHWQACSWNCYCWNITPFCPRYRYISCSSTYSL